MNQPTTTTTTTTTAMTAMPGSWNRNRIPASRWLVMVAALALIHLSLATDVAAQYQTQPNYYPDQRASSFGAIPAIPASAVTPESAEFQGQAAPAEPAEEGWIFPLPGMIAKIAEGGWLMLPLGVCSLIVLTLSLERLVALRRGRVIPRPFVRRFTECVEDGQLSHEEATEICEDFDCPVSEVFRAALRRWGRPMFEIEQAVMDAGDRVSDGLRRYLRV